MLPPDMEGKTFVVILNMIGCYDRYKLCWQHIHQPARNQWR